MIHPWPREGRLRGDGLLHDDWLRSNKVAPSFIWLGVRNTAMPAATMTERLVPRPALQCGEGASSTHPHTRVCPPPGSKPSKQQRHKSHGARALQCNSPPRDTGGARKREAVWLPRSTSLLSGCSNTKAGPRLGRAR